MWMMREDIQHLHDNWYWFEILGVVLILLGTACLVFATTATIVTALIFGYFMIAAGFFYLIGAFFTRGWGGFFLSLLAGVLYLVAGFILIMHPAEAMILYTLLLAVFFFVEGVFHIIAALSGQFRHWGLMFLSGVITTLLGVMIWQQWPFSGLWVVGAFVGIDLIMHGASYVSLGINARRIPV
jgi:uncharacterized membrane protein HdeD (DUF308 family)